jgi:hypothetical protein
VGPDDSPAPNNEAGGFETGWHVGDLPLCVSPCGRHVSTGSTSREVFERARRTQILGGLKAMIASAGVVPRLRHIWGTELR